MNFQILRTNSKHADFVHLVKQLDAYLAIRNGKENDFFVQFNSIDKLDHVVIVHVENKAIGCGAFKKYDEISAEIKRMFINPEFRGKGIASKILEELEIWAKESGFKKTILETSIEMKDAVRLYQKSGYKRIPNFGQYAEVENSCCFEKKLT